MKTPAVLVALASTFQSQELQVPPAEIAKLAQLTLARDRALENRILDYEVWSSEDRDPEWRIRLSGREVTRGKETSISIQNHLSGVKELFVWDGKAFARQYEDSAQKYVERGDSALGLPHNASLPSMFGTSYLGTPLGTLLQKSPKVIDEGRDTVAGTDCRRLLLYTPSKRSGQVSLPLIRFWIDDVETLLIMRADTYNELSAGAEMRVPDAIPVEGTFLELFMTLEVDSVFQLDNKLYVPEQFTLYAKSSVAARGYKARTVTDRKSTLTVPDDAEFHIGQTDGVLEWDRDTGLVFAPGSDTREGLTIRQLRAMYEAMSAPGSTSAALESKPLDDFIDYNCADASLVMYWLLRSLRGDLPAETKITLGDTVHNRTLASVVAALAQYESDIVAKEFKWRDIESLDGPMMAYVTNPETQSAHYCVLRSEGDGRIVEASAFHGHAVPHTLDTLKAAYGPSFVYIGPDPGANARTYWLFGFAGVALCAVFLPLRKRLKAA